MQGKIGEIMRNEAVDLLEKRMHQALDDSLVSDVMSHNQVIPSHFFKRLLWL
jgi:hypothetical protein